MMIIFEAKTEGVGVMSYETAAQAVEYCNRMGVHLDLSFGNCKVRVAPGSHPYNVHQAMMREIGKTP